MPEPSEAREWIDANWTRTGWKSPEAAVRAYERDPERFAKERRAYEAGWGSVASRGKGGGSAGRNRPASAEKVCGSCGEVKSGYLMHRGVCLDCREGGDNG